MLGFFIAMPTNQTIKMQGSFTQTTPDDSYSREGLLGAPTDPLQIEIEDSELVDIVNDYEEKYDAFYKGFNLFERRKKNELYYFGRQTQQKEDEKLLKDYESRYQDNVLYEIMGTIKPLGMSRVPDIMALPGYNSDESIEIADKVGSILDSEIKEQENRFVLGLAYKHFPVYFVSCIKGWWNNEMDDYEFGVVHPDFIKLDWTVSTKDADKMRFIIQKVPATVQDVALKFPSKKQEFYDELKKDGLMPGAKETYAALATPIQYSEVWFHEYRPAADGKVRRIDGVLWKYGDVILGKMKNPNYDYVGEKRYFAYNDIKDENTKRSINESELAQILFSGQTPENVKEEQVYHNYFRFPRKPFYFMGYDQWGKQPYDETSWIEQNVQNQKSLDKRGKQIEETLDSRGHNVFSKDALTPAQVEEIDLDDPNVDLSVAGKVNEVYTYIPPQRPTAQEFQEIGNIRQRMYGSAHSTAIRGEIKAEAPATSNQIAREGDFTAADDMVEDTINPAAQWMADWAMQFIKLRYTKDHFRWVLGVEGDMIYMKLNRNMIMDGMIVKIKASGSDKIRAQNNAIAMAKMKMIDPFNFYKDMGLSDPEGRTEKLILFNADPQAYLQKVVKNLNSSEALAQALENAEITEASNPQPASPMAGPAQPPAGNTPVVAPGGVQQPSPANTSAIPEVPTGPAPGSPRVIQG